MKLSLVEPFVAKESPQETEEFKAKALERESLFLKPIQADLGKDDLKEGPEQSPKRLFMHIDEFKVLIKRGRQVVEKLRSSEWYRKKVISRYQREIENLAATESRGTWFKYKI